MQRSQTYYDLCELIVRVKYSRSPVYCINHKDGQYSREESGVQTLRLNQDFYVAAHPLFGMCSPAEWHMVGHICDGLKTCNALWYCAPELKSSSGQRKAIKGLIEKGVLTRTETTNIYLVNPWWIRRGDFHSVIMTTAHLLRDVKRVAMEHIKACKPVKNFEVSVEQAFRNVGWL